CRHTSSRADENNIPNLQLGERHRLSVGAYYAFSCVRKQRGKRCECTAGLRNGPHLQPVSENHDRNERCELPPNIDLEEAECTCERVTKGDEDPQADGGHHPGLAVRQFAACPADKNDTAVEEDQCSKNGGDKSRARERRRAVMKPVLNV